MTEIRSYLRELEVFAGELPTFDPGSPPERPETLFVDWLTTAVDAGVREAHAMTVSTIGTDGTPSARVLLLKNLDAHGWQFAAHDSSPKGRDLAAHPVAALSGNWCSTRRSTVTSTRPCVSCHGCPESLSSRPSWIPPKQRRTSPESNH